LRPATCLITGATGAIGPCVVQAFHKAGYRVRTLSLDPQIPGMFPDNVEECIGDVTDLAAVQAAVDGCDFVIHLAALLHIANQPADSLSAYQRINYEGTATVVRASLRSQVKRLVLFSTICVYGESTGNVFTEDSIPCPTSNYAATKLEAEKIVLDARGPDGLPLGTVLRLAAVYGPRIKGNYRRLLCSLKRGRFIAIGDGRNRRTLVYSTDVARAAILAAGHPNAAGKIYNVTDGQYHTMDEIIRAICKSLGKEPPRLKLPVQPVRLTAGMLEDLARLVGVTSPIGRATIDKYTEDMAVCGNRVQSELGFVPEFDLEGGWRNMILEMRTSGDL
jgi:nucleoside-diphosphate-sugar epimerase